MKNDLTIFHDASGNPTQVMMSWVEYQKLLHVKDKPTPGMLRVDNGNDIYLPGAANTALNIPQLITTLKGMGLVTIPICARAKRMEEFTEAEQVSLEYLVRTMLLDIAPQYANTMQCTTLVVSALVEAGAFVRSQSKGPCYNDGRSFKEKFYRSVQCLTLSN